MSNSSLVSYTRISPNSTNPRNHKIDTITIHHCAGVGTAESIAAIFTPTAREASCNYAIGNDGKIALVVDEANRSWCSSSRENDHRAITIEVSNSAVGGNWPVSDAAMKSLIALCVDICKRNDIKKLNFTGDKTGNLTMHKWFAATNCPGPYLESKFPWIAEQVNKQLGVLEKPNVEDKPDLVVGQEVKLTSDAKYTNGKHVPKWVINSKLYVREIYGGNVVVSILKVGPITGVVNRRYIVVNKPYMVKVTADVLNIRAGAGTNYPVRGQIKDHGVYTIVEEKNGWGKLRSGAGWISLGYTQRV